MAFCKKVFMAFCQRRSRGFSQMAESQWNNFLETFEEHLTETGKAFLPALKLLIEQREEKIKSLIEQRAEREEKIKSLIEHRAILKENMADLREHIADLQKLKTLAELDTLKVRGLNDTRGLFGKMQEHLSATCTKGLRGTYLWEAILKQNPALRGCIEKFANVSAADVQKQAMHIYRIYTILSQHIHAGKALAELRALTGGAILYDRGPMSPEEVAIFECVGVAAGFNITEDRIPGPADRAIVCTSEFC